MNDLFMGAHSHPHSRSTNQPRHCGSTVFGNEHMRMRDMKNGLILGGPGKAEPETIKLRHE